jgi:branched-chain amino acid transport system permease protein
VFFLEATRFVVPLVPGISAVQGAALREILIAVALLLILRIHARGLIPERMNTVPLPPPVAAAAAAKA